MAELVRVAHGDAWQELGRLFAGRGGGVAEYHGVRVMASGLPDAQLNSGDVHDADADVEAARAFYGARGVPWGLRVPSEMAWSHGRRVLHLRLMGLVPSAFRPAQPSSEFQLEIATQAQLDSVVYVDAVGFSSDVEVTRPWFTALLSAPPEVVTFARAISSGETVGSGYSVSADGHAGPTAYIGGIAVLPAHRGRGCASALSSWLVQRGFEAGARLAHLHPDDDRAARVYERLGFVETAGLDVYVDA
jgi:ribosomal protein S18 acetylase RimI-like enzyme